MKSEKFSLYQNDSIWGILEDATNDGTICVKSYFGADLIINRMNELAEQIRSLEEQLKNAIVLPVRIGDKIYSVPSKVNYEINKINKKEERNKICEFVVSEIRYTKYGYSVVCYVDYIPFYFNYEIAKTHCEDFEIEQFYGETWFATREDAEKRLAELKGEGK